MGAYDWATGRLQDVVNLLFAANLNIIALLDGTSPGAPDNGNPQNLADNVAQVIQNTGFVADSLMYDAVRGGPADVTCPFAIGGIPLATSGNTEMLNLVGYYSAKLVSRLLNEHRLLQSVAAPKTINVNALINAWNSDTECWLEKVRNGYTAIPLDRTIPTVNGIGGLFGVQKCPTQYPGVPQRPAAYTFPNYGRGGGTTSGSPTQQPQPCGPGGIDIVL